MLPFIFFDAVCRDCIAASFDDQNNLPDGIIMCNAYYAETKNIFLKLEDYTSSYSKIAAYDTQSNALTNTIYACEKDYAIYDFNSADSAFVFSVKPLRHPCEEKKHLQRHLFLRLHYKRADKNQCRAAF